MQADAANLDPALDKYLNELSSDDESYDGGAPRRSTRCCAAALCITRCSRRRLRRRPHLRHAATPCISGAGKDDDEEEDSVDDDEDDEDDSDDGDGDDGEEGGGASASGEGSLLPAVPGVSADKLQLVRAHLGAQWRGASSRQIQEVAGIGRVVAKKIKDVCGGGGSGGKSKGKKQRKQKGEAAAEGARPKRTPSAYNLFMKQELAAVKSAQPELTHQLAFKQVVPSTHSSVAALARRDAACTLCAAAGASIRLQLKLRRAAAGKHTAAVASMAGGRGVAGFSFESEARAGRGDAG